MTTTVVLAGNPNTGKTSLFNALTDSYEYVGNWPGVTVEKKVGWMKAAKQGARLVDLPGVYSLNPLTADEEVATRCLLRDPVDAVLNVVDASQLRRNLQLTVQLLETGMPVVIALNMMDVAARRGRRIDVAKLAAALGVPVLPVIARTGEGCPQIACRLVQIEKPATPWQMDYGPVLEAAILRLSRAIAAEFGKDRFAGRSVRWLAIQCLEGNRVVQEAVADMMDAGLLQTVLSEVSASLRDAGESGMTPEQMIRHQRRAFLDRVVAACMDRDPHAPTVSLTERVDRIVTDKWLGMPIFFLLMLLAFMLTFDWLGSPLSDLLDRWLAGPVTSGLVRLLAAVGATPFIESLIIEGIVGGVGGVLVFVPQIFVLFFVLSLIEDSGYMARVALVMDRLAEKIGLSGKAFIPLVIGFGCNVPGVMAARTIEQPKERLLTILLAPLMSCSARLAVFSLFASVFFPGRQALVVLSLYGLGIVLALLLAKFFSRHIGKGESSPLIIELPPYRFPQWRSLWRSTWEKGKGFIVKAGTFIFGGSVLIWLLANTGPGGFGIPMENSFLAGLGGWFAPLFAPLGFGTWQAAAALITGFFAKEVVISTMNIMYLSPASGSLQGALAAVFTPVEAYTFMVFLLLYVPCLATVATIRSETRSRRWTWFSVLYALVIAYMLALLVHWGGTWLFGS